jgi:hypothetical protein
MEEKVPIGRFTCGIYERQLVKVDALVTFGLLYLA